ncbi:MAG: T9SS type A sorting domain-containing protein [Bacteroidota bacterium]|nr:T9SS type A sorting domain-containing protein [Bacteroidota bacterium]
MFPLPKEDAYRLVVRRALKDNISLKDSINIPVIYADTLLNALIAVFNANSLKAADTIKNVHTLPYPDLHTINIAADSNLNWMINLRLRTIPTGDNRIDSLIFIYKLKYYGYLAFKKKPYHAVTLKSDSFLNIKPLIAVFDSIPGVYFSEPNPQGSDGNDIKDSIYKDYIQLIYSIGWGDCPSGCINRRFWKFNVYWDCSVEFIESYENLLPITSINELKINKIDLYPNPFNEVLHIEGLNGDFRFDLYNTIGQLLREGIKVKEISGLGELKTGMYILKISSANYYSTFKIIKE